MAAREAACMTIQTTHAPQPNAKHRARGRCIVRAAGARKSFGHGVWPVRRRVEVLRGADLHVCAGELVGLVGENGSGKSTLMEILVGLLARDGGEVQRPGRLGYCPQLPMLWEKLTVAEHFALFARAYGMDDDQRDSAAGGLLEELQFSHYRDYRVEELSGGTRQKLNLALALMHGPALLLLDEPYAGFDARRMGAAQRDRLAPAPAGDTTGDPAPPTRRRLDHRRGVRAAPRDARRPTRRLTQRPHHHERAYRLLTAQSRRAAYAAANRS
jgi:ABC-2 type transport system ATP-binding protein